MITTEKFTKVMNGLDAQNHVSYKDMIKVVGGFTQPQVNKTLEETEYHQAFIVNADSYGYSYNTDDDRPERVIKSFFAAVAAYLGKNKVTKANTATALVLTDTAGTFKFAGIVEYHENENQDEPGNWSFTMTFNEDDLTSLEKKKTVNKLLFGTPQFNNIFDKVAHDVGSIEFQHSSYFYDACILVIDTIIQILDREAKSGEVVDVEMPGYFVASVSVEGDEKVMALTPDGHLKAIIKSDVALEK